MEASKILEEKGYGVRVVSMPSWTLPDDFLKDLKEEQEKFKYLNPDVEEKPCIE